MLGMSRNHVSVILEMQRNNIYMEYERVAYARRRKHFILHCMLVGEGGGGWGGRKSTQLLCGRLQWSMELMRVYSSIISRITTSIISNNMCFT